LRVQQPAQGFDPVAVDKNHVAFWSADRAR
jgi:hypothetical protein